MNYRLTFSIYVSYVLDLKSKLNIIEGQYAQVETAYCPIKEWVTNSSLTSFRE